MIEYIFTVAIILISLFGYKLLIKPKKLYDRYVRDITALGYKVHALPFTPFRLPLLQVLAQGTREGDAFKFWKTVCPNVDVVVASSIHQITLDISNPDFIKDFYSSQHLYTYPKARIITMAIQRAMGRGIAFSEGDQWKRKRRIISGVFNFEFIRSMTGKIERLCQKAIKEVEEEASHTSQNGEHVVEYEIIDLTVKMFSSVILECFLGGAVQEKIDGKPVCIFISELMTDITKQTYKPLNFLIGPKHLNWGLTAFDRDVNRRLRLFKKWGLAYIDRKVEQANSKLKNEGNVGAPEDIIQALVRAQANSQMRKQDFYSNEQIFEEFSTFFVAGTDTSAHYVMMMIYYIAQNPSVEQKLRKQIETFMEKDDYSYDNLKNFIYIDNIQKQTTRLYGPANGLFVRTAKQDNILNGLRVSKGTIVRIQHTGNHHSQKYFPDPLVFRPQRWEKQCDNLPPYSMGGFSAGARTCLGRHLATIESKIGLIKFMKRYKKTRIPEGPIKMVIKFLYSPEYFKSKMTIDEKKGSE